jgi:hypothetical protein
MKMPGIYIIVPIVAVFGGACEDVYVPKEINSNMKIPVIQGIIIKDKVPVVTLSWALGYESQLLDYISGAHVTVFDNLGDSVNLEETSAGNYTTMSDEFKGVEGRDYTLHVELPNGNLFTSTSELLLKKPVVDSLYAILGSQTVYSYDESKKPFADVEPGLTVMADLSADSDTTHYYRFFTKLVKERVFTVNVNTLLQYTNFLWDTELLDDPYSVNLTVSKNHRQLLRQHHIGFLHYYYDNANENDSTTGTFIVAWVLTCQVFSISRHVYDYYNSVTQQLNANDEIFAPPPAQPSTNISCVNDPKSKSIGVFEAVSVTTVYKAFGWNDLTKFYSMDLSAFPDSLTSGETSKFPPYWWVLFRP